MTKTKMKKMPERIFCVLDNETVPDGDRTKSYGEGFKYSDGVSEDSVIEKHWKEDIMLSGCVSHPREWFATGTENRTVGIYKLIETRVMPRLTDEELEVEDCRIRIPDRWKK